MLSALTLAYALPIAGFFVDIFGSNEGEWDENWKRQVCILESFLIEQAGSCVPVVPSGKIRLLELLWHPSTYWILPSMRCKDHFVIYYWMSPLLNNLGKPTPGMVE